jgi:hypothetical protein
MWLEARSRWSQLRVLGNSGLVRASVLMPAFGYLLLLNDNVHQYLTIKYDGWLLHYLPSIWRIWLVFYGSFFLAIGTILFTAFCPEEVKRYVSAFEMADAECRHHVNLGQQNQVQAALRALYQGRSKWEQSLGPKPPPYLHVSGTFADGMVSAMLVHQWTIVNLGRPALRIFVLLLFGIGLILLAVPAAITFIQVTVLPLKQLVAWTGL